MMHFLLYLRMLHWRDRTISIYRVNLPILPILPASFLVRAHHLPSQRCWACETRVESEETAGTRLVVIVKPYVPDDCHDEHARSRGRSGERLWS